MRIVALPVALPVALVAATTGQAGPFDGLYVPRGERGSYWDRVYNGQVAGAIWIEDDRYHPIEDPICELTNPVKIRNMPAVLYDLDCGEWNQDTLERVMFVQQDDGMFEIRAGWMVDWESCGEG